MIIVSGTKRSGTSLWMQILSSAGLPYIGKPFLSNWEQSIKDANPKGFYESKLRDGVYYASNPDPQTGSFIFPAQSRDHVLKVFIPGLVRTDYAYLDRVLATMRPWRTYCASIERLRDMEVDWQRKNPSQPAVAPSETADPKADAHSPEVKARRYRKAPLPIEWWHQYYDLIRDVATRRYPFHLISYDRVLANPQEEIDRVLRWIGKGELAQACKAVEPGLKHDFQKKKPDIEGLDPEWLALFDELYDHVHCSRPLNAAFLERMNQAHGQITEKFGKLGYISDPRAVVTS